MKTNKLTTAALTLGLTFGAASLALAHGNMQGNMMQGCRGMNGNMMGGNMMGGNMMGGNVMGGNMMMGMFFQLDLSTKQQQEIQAIMTQAMAGRQVMMANMPAYMAECQALTTAPTFDEAKARAMLAKRQGVMSENMLTMLKARHQAYQLLTPAQQEQYLILMQQMSANMQNMMGSQSQHY